MTHNEAYRKLKSEFPRQYASIHTDVTDTEDGDTILYSLYVHPPGGMITRHHVQRGRLADAVDSMIAQARGNRPAKSAAEEIGTLDEQLAELVTA